MARIGILFEFPTVNGGEHSMLSSLRLLQSSDSVSLIAIAPAMGELATRLATEDIPVVPFQVRDDGGRRPTADLLQELQFICQQQSLDLLHANSLSMSRLAGQLPPCRWKRTGHLRDIIKLNKKVIADLNQNDGLIAVSAATRDAHAANGLDSDRCRIIYNGVDTQQFAPATTTREQRQRLFPLIPPDSRILLTAGQICLRKGQLLIADAVCRLLDEGLDLHLVMAGERHSSKQESVDYEAALHHRFDQSGYASRLRPLGYRVDMPVLMNACDVLVHAAHQEPFGRVLLEAAACGRPIVATQVGGTQEMLNQDAAELIVPGQVSALADAVKRLLQEPQRAAALGDAARQRVLSDFTAEKATQQLRQFWNDQLAESSI